MKRAGGMAGLTAEDVMTSPVATADACETLYDVRVTMLGHGYSALPVRTEAEWRWLTDKWLIDAIRAHGVVTTLSEVMENTPQPLDRATTICRSRRVAEVETPALVVEGERAIGVVTAFDMLLVV